MLPRDSCVTTPTQGLLFLLGGGGGQIHNLFWQHPSGTNLPLRHLQDHTQTHAHTHTPLDAIAVSSKQFMAEVSVHFAVELSWSMIDWQIDWLWFMFFALCVVQAKQLSLFFSLSPSLSRLAVHLLTLEQSVRVKLLCILSRQPLPDHTSATSRKWRSVNIHEVCCRILRWWDTAFRCQDDLWFEIQFRHSCPTKKKKGHYLHLLNKDTNCIFTEQTHWDSVIVSLRLLHHMS